MAANLKRTVKIDEKDGKKIPGLQDLHFILEWIKARDSK